MNGGYKRITLRNPTLDFGDVLHEEGCVTNDSSSVFNDSEMRGRWLRICSEFAQGVDRGHSCASIANYMREINRFLDRNVAQLRRERSSISFLQESLVQTKLIYALWQVVIDETSSVFLLESCYYFIAKICFLSEELITFLMQEDFISMIVIRLLQLGETITRSCVLSGFSSLLNILTKCSTKDEAVIQHFDSLVCLFERFGGEGKDIVKFACLLAIRSGNLHTNSILAVFKNYLSFETYNLIVCTTMEMAKQNPAVFEHIASTGFLQVILEMQRQNDSSDFIGNTSNVVLAIAQGSLLFTQSLHVKSLIERSVPIDLLHAFLESEDCAFFISAMELLTVLMPSRLFEKLLELYSNSSVCFLEKIVLTRLSDGTQTEKLCCLRFLLRAMDEIPEVRQSLLTCGEMIDTYIDIFQSFDLLMCEYLIEILMKLLCELRSDRKTLHNFLEEFFQAGLVDSISELMASSPAELSQKCQNLLDHWHNLMSRA